MPVASPGKLVQHLRLAAGFRSFLGSPLTLDQAERELRSRLEARETRLLTVLRDLVYRNRSSPYLRALRAAGCELGDLGASARAHGADWALASLAAAGVRTSVEELKSSGAAFDNPRFLGKALTGATSGTTTPRSRVVLDWHGLAEESANELLLYAAHGLERAPLALYLPPPPGLAGVRNLVIHAKLGRPPEAWFDPGSSVGVVDQAQAAALSWAARLHGVRLPQPVEAGPEQVAAWLAADGAERRVLSAFTGPALRVVPAAEDGPRHRRQGRLRDRRAAERRPTAPARVSGAPGVRALRDRRERRDRRRVPRGRRGRRHARLDGSHRCRRGGRRCAAVHVPVNA